MRFLLFTARRRGTKRSFRCFLFIVGVRNADFAVFRSSSVDETQNSLFLAHHPWMKVGFFPFFDENRGRFCFPTVRTA